MFHKTVAIALAVTALAIAGPSPAHAHPLASNTRAATSVPGVGSTTTAAARSFSCKGYGGRDGKLVEGTLSSAGVLTNVTVKDWTGRIVEVTIPNPVKGTNPVKDASGASVAAYDFPGNTYWIISTHAYPTTGHAAWAIILPSTPAAGPTFTAVLVVRTIFFAGVACSYV
jgi:hypothetical protein